MAEHVKTSPSPKGFNNTARAKSPSDVALDHGGDTAGEEMDRSVHIDSPLGDFDWEAIEREYVAKLQAFADEERITFAEFDHWVKAFEAWAATTISHENERASKRLRTRITHVQMSEERLEKKRQHYMKVVEAFRGALDMLE